MEPRMLFLTVFLSALLCDTTHSIPVPNEGSPILITGSDAREPEAKIGLIENDLETAAQYYGGYGGYYGGYGGYGGFRPHYGYGYPHYGGYGGYYGGGYHPHFGGYGGYHGGYYR